LVTELHNQVERNVAPIQRAYRNRETAADFLRKPQQSPLSSFHRAGREFFLLRLEDPICESAGWTTVL
jgi:hypothetical protein